MFRLLILVLVAGCSTLPDKDKLGHFAVGYGISRAVTEVTGNQFAGCTAALAAGVAKEGIDSLTHPGEGMDAYITTVGGCNFSIPF